MDGLGFGALVPSFLLLTSGVSACCTFSVMLFLSGWGSMDPFLCAPMPVPQAVRSELLEGFEGPVCGLSLSENQWVLPVFLEVQLPAESRLGSQEARFVHSVFSAGSCSPPLPALEIPKGRAHTPHQPDITVQGWGALLSAHQSADA